LKGDVMKIKQALAILYTTRGVPQIYYGEEINMAGDGAYHPNIRKNIPGGWAGDSADVFTGRGMGAEAIDMLAYNTKLLNWRKTSKAVGQGSLVQYIPDNNIYVYFRTAGTDRVMVIVNGESKAQDLKLNRFQENLIGANSMKDVLTGKPVDLKEGKITLEPNSVIIGQMD